MAVEPSYYLPPITLPKSRTSQQRLKLYADDGAPATFVSADNFRAKLWAKGSATPAIDVDESGTTSRVEVVSLGVAGVTPAEMIVHFHETETANLTAGGEYLWELLAYVDADGVNRSICQGPVVVAETTGGDTGA